jgi:putative membrane protein
MAEARAALLIRTGATDRRKPKGNFMSDSFLAVLGTFSMHLAAGVLLMIAFLILYMRATPHEEVTLIREGNTAAAVGLAGAILGFAIALSRSISISAGIQETIVWGLIALLVQVGGHYLVRLMFPDFQAEIEKGSMPAAVILATTGVALGLLNAASMTP